jgi:hypothetical protein
MKASSLKQLLIGGLAAVVAGLNAQADVTVLIVGGNATRAIQFDRAANLLTGETVVNGANSNIRSFVNGTIPSLPILGKVTIHFRLDGATLGLQQLRDQVNVTTATGAALKPNLAVSGAFPETVGIDGSIFQSRRTLVIPFGFVKNDALPNTLHGVTNLTQRQAALLQATAGTLPTAFYGGESTTDPLYVIGRDTGAAVRQVIDANIYFTGSPSFFTTNAAPKPALPPTPIAGHDGGGKVVSDLLVIPNAIGTLAASDFGSFTPLAYEGFLPTRENVAKGKYPIWGYESWYTKNSGLGQPDILQQQVLGALYSAVTDTTFQTTSPLFSTLVPLSVLEVERTADGGPITSLFY